MASETYQIESSVLADFGLNEIIDAKFVVVEGTKYDPNNEDIRDDLAQLRYHLTRIKENVERLFQVIISASTTEINCPNDGKCCAFDSGSLIVKGGGTFYIKFMVSLAGVKITVEFMFTSSPEILSHDLKGLCGEKNCDNQQLSVHAFTTYDGKLTISATGEVVFGKLKIGELEFVIQVKSPSAVINQPLACVME